MRTKSQIVYVHLPPRVTMHSSLLALLSRASLSANINPQVKSESRIVITRYRRIYV